MIDLKKVVFKNIASIITFSFIVVTMIPFVLVSAYAYNYLRGNIYDDYYKKSEQIVNGVDSNLNIYMNGWKTVSENIFGSPVVQDAISSQSKNYYDQMKTTEKLKSYILNSVGARGDLLAVSILNESGETIYRYDTFNMDNIQPNNNEVLEILKANGNKFTIIGPQYQIYRSGNQRNIFTVGRRLRDISTGKQIGYLIINIDYSMIEKTISMSNNNQASTLVITDTGNHIVFNSENRMDITKNYNKTYTYNKFSDNNSLSFEVRSSYFDWNYVMLSTNEEIIKDLTNVSLFFILLFIVTTLLFMFCAILISKSVAKPLIKLGNTMKNAADNNFNEILPVSRSYDEVNRLTGWFNIMLVEIQKHLDREKQEWKKEADSRYKALQLQITPHFLYNSLESINCLATINNQKEISKMIISLSRIFKYNMKYDSNVATLQDEINHVKNYCNLQAINYQNKFRIVYDIKDEYLDYHVVKFMLQPIVENAINHGLKEKQMGDTITITAFENSDEFVVEVNDNGAGIEKEKAEKLKEMFKLDSSELYEIDKQGDHIGLININLRLKLQFGEKAGIYLYTKENEGTAFFIHLPKNKQ